MLKINLIGIFIILVSGAAGWVFGFMVSLFTYNDALVEDVTLYSALFIATFWGLICFLQEKPTGSLLFIPLWIWGLVIIFIKFWVVIIIGAVVIALIAVYNAVTLQKKNELAPPLRTKLPQREKSEDEDPKGNKNNSPETATSSKKPAVEKNKMKVRASPLPGKKTVQKKNTKTKRS